jgi:hypothetical protein
VKPTATSLFNQVLRQAAPYVLGDVFYHTAWQLETVTGTVTAPSPYGVVSVFNAFPIRATTNSQTISGLLAKTIYEFQVGAINTAGGGLFSSVSATPVTTLFAARQFNAALSADLVPVDTTPVVDEFLASPILMSDIASAQTALDNGAREPWMQPFNSTSVWNTPIGSNAIWSNPSDLDTIALNTPNGTINAGSFGQPFFRGQESDPLVTFTNIDTLAPLIPQQIHCPATATPAGPFPGGDCTMTLFDATNPGLMWSYHSCSFNNGQDVTGGVTAEFGQVDNVCGTGVDADSNTFGYNFGIGTIRLWELAAGSIQHSLRFAAPAGMLASPGPAWDQNVPWPNTHVDFNSQDLYTGNLLAGCTIGIPNSVDLSGLGLSPGGYLLAITLQTYGAIWRDSSDSDGIVFFAEPAAEGDPLIDDMRMDMSLICSVLAVLRNQGPTSINGGGLPLISPPAALDTIVCPITNIPARVTGLSVTNAAGTSLTLSWDDVPVTV